MTDPVTASFAASAALGAAGSITQGYAASRAAGYNAKVAGLNAQVATENANFAGSTGNINVGQEGAQTKSKIANTLANQGASGVNVNTGSAVDVRASEAKIGMVNALNIRSNAAREAYGFETKAQSEEAQAALLRSQQGPDVAGGYFGAAGKVLGGINQYEMLHGTAGDALNGNNATNSASLSDYNNGNPINATVKEY